MKVLSALPRTYAAQGPRRQSRRPSGQIRIKFSKYDDVLNSHLDLVLRLSYILAMTDTPDLFADLGPEFAPKPARLEVVAGLVVANMGKPTAAQKRFNKLVASIDAARTESETLRRVVDAQRPAHYQAMHTLSTEIVQLQKSMVVFLDTRLQGKGLSANQQKQASRILLSLCEQLAHLEDDAVEAVLARYLSPEDLADRDQEEALAAQEAKEFMEGYLGKDFGGQDFKTPEDVLRAAMEHERGQATARAEKRAAKKAKRAPNAREQAEAKQQLDAQGTLRTIYRQLASALHPDRSSDAADRDRKTALMKAVNAAYERKDLTELLRMQLTVEQVDASKLAALSDEKLQAMCLLLAEQFKALQEDIESQRMQMAHDFGYDPHLRFREDDLQEAIAYQRQTLKNDADFMREDLASVHDDKTFKAWLKEQTRITKAAQREADAAMSMDDIIFEMMRGR